MTRGQISSGQRLSGQMTMSMSNEPLNYKKVLTLWISANWKFFRFISKMNFRKILSASNRIIVQINKDYLYFLLEHFLKRCKYRIIGCYKTAGSRTVMYSRRRKSTFAPKLKLYRGNFEH
jgi:hypothetical protein